MVHTVSNEKNRVTLLKNDHIIPNKIKNTNAHTVTHFCHLAVSNVDLSAFFCLISIFLITFSSLRPLKKCAKTSSLNNFYN